MDDILYSLNTTDANRALFNFNQTITLSNSATNDVTVRIYSCRAIKDIPVGFWGNDGDSVPSSFFLCKYNDAAHTYWIGYDPVNALINMDNANIAYSTGTLSVVEQLVPTPAQAFTWSIGTNFDPTASAPFIGPAYDKDFSWKNHYFFRRFLKVRHLRTVQLKPGHNHIVKQRTQTRVFSKIMNYEAGNSGSFASLGNSSKWDLNAQQYYDVTAPNMSLLKGQEIIFLHVSTPAQMGVSYDSTAAAQTTIFGPQPFCLAVSTKIDVMRRYCPHAVVPGAILGSQYYNPLSGDSAADGTGVPQPWTSQNIRAVPVHTGTIPTIRNPAQTVAITT